MTADDYADLARLAEAATPGYDWPAADEWAAQLDMTGLFPQHSEAQFAADGAWIAAANPATILRLIAEVRRLTDERAEWHQQWDDVRVALQERHELAARLAAVEADHDALIDRLTAAKALHTPQPGQGTAYCQDCDQRWPCPTRAVLSTAPTDTTKET